MAALPSLALLRCFAAPVPTLHTASPSATSFLPLKSQCARSRFEAYLVGGSIRDLLRDVPPKCGFEAYLVGGSIRDLLLDVPPKDYDVLSTATTHQVCAAAFLSSHRDCTAPL
ncbi:unnamed protein product [Closterium sp. NIES-64]|nr:unnamed protein product [Closterium sp. NIES-64]